MSLAIRSSAKNPTNADARTITSSDIGRRRAKDTKFIGLLSPM
jgi:hypothetical protein